jgi:hypothetical protein
LDWGKSSLKAWPVIGIFLMQVFLLLAHWFIFHTWVVFWGAGDPVVTEWLRAALLVLAFSFMSAALLSFRFHNHVVMALYKVAAVWLGFLNFFFWASCLCWLVWFGLHLFGVQSGQRMIAIALFMGFAAGIYGLINARWVRLRRITVKLRGLPASWRGRTALLLSDLHLGHINGKRFIERLIDRANTLNPDVIFLPGDLFDGGKIDTDHLAMPFSRLSPRFGTYFSTGNHDEFGNVTHYTAALERAGVRVLNNDRAIADGLQIVGISYHESNFPLRLRATLEAFKLAEGGASILLNHVPNRLPIVEQAGVSLQLSGHTHGGQIVPFTWLTRRVFGKFTYGLHSFGSLLVYTSSGAGTWGPPMRVGTHPEIVLLTFE